MAARRAEDAFPSVRGRGVASAAKGRAASCSSAPSPASACPTASRPRCIWCRASGRIFARLQAAGFTVTPRAEGDGFDAALVLAGRHRGAKRAADRRSHRTRPAGRAGRHRRRQGRRHRQPAQAHRALVPLEGHLPKHHGIAFWFRPPGARRALLTLARRQSRFARRRPLPHRARHVLLRSDRCRVETAGRRICPAICKGNVADFCAGWGYLAAEVAARSPGCRVSISTKRISRRWRRQGQHAAGSRGARFFWTDLLTETSSSAMT